jgi:thiol:disulfide interchange protein
MRALPYIIGLIIAIALILPVQASNSLPEYSLKYSPSRDPFKDGLDAIKLAQQSNRRILIEVGGEWCKWCHLLDDFLDKNSDIKQRLHNTFVLLKINVSDANDNQQFLQAFPQPLGYPHMYVTEKNGDILWSKDTADFLNEGRYSRQKFTEFFDRWEIKQELKDTLIKHG